MKHRGKVTATGILVVLGALGTAFYTGTEKLIALDQKLGRGAYADSVLDARLTRIERRLKLKKGEFERQAPREGIVRRIWRLLI